MMSEADLPLGGLLVVDLSQFLAGPYAALRLLDLGARVIKVERPDGGDPCRDLYKTRDQRISTLFQAINRGKESLALDLKLADDLAVLRQALERADVVIQNYRPGIAERLGIGYEAVRAINPRVIYASISGYGRDGPWAKLPGQDLLAQARSGIMWLSGDQASPPTPVGLAVGDIYTGAMAVQGILAALVRRGVTGRGALVETSLLESLVDLQFEMITEYFANQNTMRFRSEASNGNINAPPPYGVYRTSDGYLALAMTPLQRLAPLLDLDPDPAWEGDHLSLLVERDQIKRRIAERIVMRSTAHWLAALQPHDIWCAEVMDWTALLRTEQFAALDMLQDLPSVDAASVRTTRMPISIDGVRPRGHAPAPALGAHSEALRRELAGNDAPLVSAVKPAL
ncbi:acyl-CoA transferase [Sphingomonas turrisvirgatae]|uniref:Acyl-CoA transferase n=2 Tax=Sphingomonadaceae TaxID=41297 RepID=A0A1E3LS88_9SPHN|nr:acyl-CoA transferase [Sphingomonas turrisvirgatae]